MATKNMFRFDFETDRVTDHFHRKDQYGREFVYSVFFNGRRFLLTSSELDEEGRARIKTIEVMTLAEYGEWHDDAIKNGLL